MEAVYKKHQPMFHCRGCLTQYLLMTHAIWSFILMKYKNRKIINKIQGWWWSCNSTFLLGMILYTHSLFFFFFLFFPISIQCYFGFSLRTQSQFQKDYKVHNCCSLGYESQSKFVILGVFEDCNLFQMSSGCFLKIKLMLQFFWLYICKNLMQLKLTVPFFYC